MVFSKYGHGFFINKFLKNVNSFKKCLFRIPQSFIEAIEWKRRNKNRYFKSSDPENKFNSKLPEKKCTKKA